MLKLKFLRLMIFRSKQELLLFSDKPELAYNQDGNDRPARNLQSVYKTDSFRDYMNSTKEMNPEMIYQNNSNFKGRPNTESINKRSIQNPKLDIAKSSSKSHAIAIENRSKDFEMAEELDLDYGKIKENIIIDDQSENPQLQTKNNNDNENVKKKRHKERDSFNDSRSISLLGTHMSMESIKRQQKIHEEGKKKDACLSVLFHSDFNGLIKAEVERATLRANYLNSSYSKTFDAQNNIGQHNNSLQKIINYKSIRDVTNSVRPLFPVQIEPFQHMKQSQSKSPSRDYRKKSDSSKLLIPSTSEIYNDCDNSMKQKAFFTSPVTIKIEKSMEEIGKDIQKSLVIKSKNFSNFESDEYPKCSSNKSKLAQNHKLMADKKNRRERQLLNSCFQMFSKQKIKTKLFIENSA